MELKLNGKIVKGVGGIYAIRVSANDADVLTKNGVKLEGDTLFCRARGAFRHEKLTLLVGDEVVLRVDTELASVSAADSRDKRAGRDEAQGGVMIEEMLPRGSELIRPPMSNLDIIFAVVAAAKPDPVQSTLDKLITIAEYKKITPVIIITKADLAPEVAQTYAELYNKCGFTVFVEGFGIDDAPLETYIRDNADKTLAFAGASGVGKSTLLNRLFPSLELQTGEVSEKTQRGRHTTRHIELYPLDRQFGDAAHGYIADTPGFGMLDFVQFDFYTKADLPYVFREFDNYIGECKYIKCTHTKEDGCAILEAVKRGDIPAERHKSYLEFYEVLKNKHEWDKK